MNVAEINEISGIIVDAAMRVHTVHECQLLTYLKLSRHRLGLMFNSHEAHLRDGIRRIANNL